MKPGKKKVESLRGDTVLTLKFEPFQVVLVFLGYCLKDISEVSPMVLKTLVSGK